MHQGNVIELAPTSVLIQEKYFFGKYKLLPIMKTKTSSLNLALIQFIDDL